MPRNKYFSVIFIAAILICLPFIAKAVGAAGVGGSPAYNKDSWFIYNLDRDESKEDGLELVNFSKEESVGVKIYAVDGNISKDGTFNCLDETDARKDVGAWIEFETTELVLGPEETIIIPFTITIPKDAAVGDHFGAVIIEKVNLDSVEGQPGLSIKTRLGVRVYQTVPGEIIKELEITGLSWKIKDNRLTERSTTGEKIKTALGLNKHGIIEVGLRNDGNVHLNPRAVIEITDIFGSYVETLENVFLGISPPYGKETLREVKWEKPSLFGRLTARITIPIEGSESVSEKICFWIVPWPLIFVFFVLLIVFIFVKLFWRLYSAVLKLRMEPHKISKKQSLNEVADNFGISWKKLARTNALKPPYSLEKGMIILVPAKKAPSLIKIAKKELPKIASRIITAPKKSLIILKNKVRKTKKSKKRKSK